MWLILAIIGHLTNALVFITDKAFVQKIYPSPRALAFISGAAGIFTFMAFPWFLRPAPYDVVGAAIAAGAISIPGLFYFFSALQKDEVSRVVPAIGSITPLFTFGLSYVLLVERLPDRFLAAFGLLAFGGLLMAFRSFRDVFSQHSYSLFSLEILTAFLFALSFVLQKYAFEGTDDFSAFLWSRVGAVGAALPFLASREVRERLRFSELRGSGIKTGALYIVSRIFAGISPLIILLAISFGSASLVNALQGIQYVFLFLLAILFSSRWPDIFKEELNKSALAQKSLATLLIVAGLALLI